jgi:hypothetical protein
MENHLSSNTLLKANRLLSNTPLNVTAQGLLVAPSHSVGGEPPFFIKHVFNVTALVLLSPRAIPSEATFHQTRLLLILLKGFLSPRAPSVASHLFQQTRLLWYGQGFPVAFSYFHQWRAT